MEIVIASRNKHKISELEALLSKYVENVKLLSLNDVGLFEDVEEEAEFNIRTKTFSIKPMSVEDAILQMNLLGHQFFVFEDASSGDTCVVYVRHDGDYGLIVPTK